MVICSKFQIICIPRFQIIQILNVLNFFANETTFAILATYLWPLTVGALWSPAGKGLTSWLSFVVAAVSLSLSHWYPGSGVVLDCIDS